MKKLAAALFGLGLAAATVNAYALCVKADGSLDDPSMSPGSIAMDMVPSCDDAGGSKQPAAAEGYGKSDKTASAAPRSTNHPATK